MPPKWALGYHQCRWSYDSADRVLEVGSNVAFVVLRFSGSGTILLHSKKLNLLWFCVGVV